MSLRRFALESGKFSMGARSEGIRWESHNVAKNDPDSSCRWGVLLVIFICYHRSFSVDRRRNLNFEKISKDFEK
jgi:hypothetical protein